jgi:hypothetical protein
MSQQSTSEMSSGSQKKTRTSANEAMGTELGVARTFSTLKDIINNKVDELRKPHEEIVSQYNAVLHQLASGKTHYTEKVAATKQWVSGERDMNANERAAAEKVAAELAPKVKEATLKKAAFSQVRIRVSAQAGVYLSIVADKLATDLLLHGMQSAVKEECTMVRLCHIHQDGLETLLVYPLCSGIDIFKKTATAVLCERQAEKAAEELKAYKKVAAEELRAAKKAIRKEFNDKFILHRRKDEGKEETTPAAAAAAAAPADAAPATPAEPAPAAESSSVSDATAASHPFFHYVGKIRKTLSKQHPELNVKNKPVKASKEALLYISDIVYEFVTRVGRFSALLILDLLDNKTVTVEVLKTVIKSMMVDSHTPSDVITLENVMVPAPDLLKAAEAKSAEEKKAGRDGKFDIESIPKVPGFKATRVISYPTSQFDTLAAEVARKSDLIPKKEPKKKPDAPADVPAPTPADVPDAAPVATPIPAAPVAN